MTLLSRRFTASFRGYQLLADSDQQVMAMENGNSSTGSSSKSVAKDEDNEEQHQDDEEDSEEVEGVMGGDGGGDLRNADDKSRLIDSKESHRGHQQSNNINKYFLIPLFLITVLLFIIIIIFTFFSSSMLLPTRRPPIVVKPNYYLPFSTNSLSSSSSSLSTTITIETSPPPSTTKSAFIQQKVSSTLLSDSATTTYANGGDNKTLVNSSSSFIYDRFIVYTPNCKIPSIPVFTAETKPLYQKYKSKEWKCPADDGTSAIKRVNFTSVSVPEDNCNATLIERDASNESVKLGQTIAFKKRRVIDFPDADAVKVVCPGLKASKILPLIPMKKPIWRKQEPKSEDTSTTEPESEPEELDLSHRPNILAIGIDSISRLNYLRHFSEMQAFLKEEGNFEGPLYGLQKIGDNTFPNLIGMFTVHYRLHAVFPGQKSYDITSKLPPSRKLDDVPLIFKKFSAKSYLTTYIENMPNWGLWTYHEKSGFGKQQPLEYLMRPVNILVYRDMKNSYCYKDRLEMELYYDFLIDQMRAFRARQNRFLTFIHMGAISHDHLNYAQYADGPMTRFMKRIFADHLHNDTLIIFYSDHGIRFGSIVQTDSGFQESRMPFMFFRIPEMMRLKDEKGNWQNSSQLRATFRLNSRRLTSQFDVHATLMHLLDEEPPKDEPYGHSLFTPIPLDRTCEQAGIPDEYCTCSPFSELKDQKILVSLTEHMITYLNGRLTPWRAKCADLSLDTVLKAKMSEELPSKASDGANSTLIFGSRRRFFMRIRLLPSKGSVEMILQGVLLPKAIEEEDNNTNGSSPGLLLDRSSLSVVSGIIRLDRYNEQSKCVANTRVESFCYCRNLLEKKKDKKGS